jgi:hypothetical protein
MTRKGDRAERASHFPRLRIMSRSSSSMTSMVTGPVGAGRFGFRLEPWPTRIRLSVPSRWMILTGPRGADSMREVERRRSSWCFLEPGFFLFMDLSCEIFRSPATGDWSRELCSDSSPIASPQTKRAARMKNAGKQVDRCTTIGLLDRYRCFYSR